MSCYILKYLAKREKIIGTTFASKTYVIIITLKFEEVKNGRKENKITRNDFW